MANPAQSDTDSLHERRAALNRAVASLQLLNEEIQAKGQRDRTSLAAEYWALKATVSKLTNGFTTLPLDRGKVRTSLLRLKEIRRCVTMLDEVIGGAKYQVDTDEPKDIKKESDDMAASWA